MDWQTIITAVVASLLSSSLITAGIIYILKKSIDRAIDLRYEKLLEEIKLNAQETARRKSVIYDQKSKALQVYISHLHRLRRMAREMMGPHADHNQEMEWQEFDKTFNEFNQHHKEFLDFISDNRVFLPIKYAQIQHDTIGLVANIRSYRALAEKTKSGDPDFEVLKESYTSILKRLDEQYVQLLEDAQTSLGTIET